MIKNYYRLTKPGIIRGNLITATAGFFLAAGGNVDWLLLLVTLAGIALVIASACVFNNYIDRNIDSKMARTKKRELVTGEIPFRNALIFGTALGIAGFLIIAIYINLFTLVLGLIAYIVYIVLYGLSKRRSHHGTLIGSISGAIPPAAGYTAAAGNFDSGAFILFLILVFWQMPHFYAIAIYRLKEYKAADIPVLPIVRGLRATKIQMLAYTMLFIASTIMLTLFEYTGIVYLLIVSIVGLLWLIWIAKGFFAQDDERWARSVFSSSLLVLLTFSLMISLDSFLP